ncbi:endothelial lipase-like isoform X2 [Sitodiplosis mosellana]|uniref:endothelial lipase-like isoform X2 n=1 Tax=Sitodiplosis mosellana TaxID=263140 RepID=UPI0024453530|nr:endothelial lipase-like isoform X2 [Sitodiplosis mosellana]
MPKILFIIFLTVIALMSHGTSSPLFPFDMFSKCYIADDKCPNENVTFWLYTRSTQDSPQQLNMANEDTITSAKYTEGRPWLVLLHGYTGDKDYSPNSHLRPALFQNGEYNVISLDYHPLAPEPCYVQAVHNLPTVAKCTAQLLDFMMGKGMFTLDDLHIIGFSLGAQTAGMISNFVKTGKIRRITALDPAKPMFIFADAEHRVGPDDADFVQVVHTDAFARGVLSASGHVDFYMNGGIEQPGCSTAAQQNQSTGSCNHDRAPIYFAESINSEAGFWGFKCSQWTDWAMGLCRNSREQAIMGWKATNESQGIFMVYTNREPPYARGKQ